MRSSLPIVATALLSAALFGLSTPLTKLLVSGVPPLLLAALLYLGSGLGLAAVLAVRRLGGRRARLAAPHGRQWLWLTAAVLAGGCVGPVLLTYGLVDAPASTAALLLNLEGVFTALLAWFAFRENFDRRIALGMLLVVAGGVALVHLTERHEHEHRHEPMVHEHAHVHDEHHEHAHEPDWDSSEPHTHEHHHAPLVHRHAHFPDLHHQHRHL